MVVWRCCFGEPWGHNIEEQPVALQKACVLPLRSLEASQPTFFPVFLLPYAVKLMRLHRGLALPLRVVHALPRMPHGPTGGITDGDLTHPIAPVV